GADRRKLSAHSSPQARQGDACDVPGRRDGGPDGGQYQGHLHRDLRHRLRPCGRGRRPPRPGFPRHTDDGGPRLAEGVRDRHTRWPRQHHGRNHRRIHPRIRRGDRRRLHLVRVSGRNGVPDHHRGAAVQADRAVRAGGAHWMKRALPAFWLVILLTVPLWLQDQYILHILITTGIFIIAAMSLNLLLGYTGQLSLGHVAFFGIGAYASALTTLGFDVELLGLRVVHQPWPAIVGLFV